MPSFRLEGTAETSSGQSRVRAEAEGWDAEPRPPRKLAWAEPTACVGPEGPAQARVSSGELGAGAQT